MPKIEYDVGKVVVGEGAVYELFFVTHERRGKVNDQFALGIVNYARLGGTLGTMTS